jgi:hypothetical protein
MSSFIERNAGFTLYESPKSGGEAFRTWLYFAGTDEAVASNDDEHYYGRGETHETLVEWGYRDSYFVRSRTKVKIALKRNPYERFISTFYENRVAMNNLDCTLDYFLENFEEVIANNTIKMYKGDVNLMEFLFSTQTAHLGKKQDYYNFVVDYREMHKLNTYLQGVWNVALPDIELPNSGKPCDFTGNVCEFDLSTRQKRHVERIYAEDFANGWV